MFELTIQVYIDKADWHRQCGFPLTSYVQMAQGLGYEPGEIHWNS